MGDGVDVRSTKAAQPVRSGRRGVLVQRQIRTLTRYLIEIYVECTECIVRHNAEDGRRKNRTSHHEAGACKWCSIHPKRSRDGQGQHPEHLSFL